MPSRFVAGEEVQTPLGKGVVRATRSQGRFLIEINGRSMLLEERAISPIDPRTKARAEKEKKKRTMSPPSTPSSAPRDHRALEEIDLHGLTVEEALARVETAVNEALLADRSELRVIHGRGTGRIRAALHRWLREVSTVSVFHLDPRNSGVTIVRF